MMAALYARVSSDRQKEDQTIGSQIAALQEHARNAGYDVPEEWIFQDEGYSGAILVRPALEQLRDLIAEGALDAVIVHSPDRLSRKYAYQVLLLEEFARHGTEVVFLRAPAGTTPEDQLLVQFQGMIAEYERALIMERTRRGKLHRARSGSVSVLGGAPYGYRYVRRTDCSDAYYEVLPEQAQVVEEVFRLYTQEGYSIAGLTRWLNERQVLTCTGKCRWERSTVWAMLRNPAYKGIACFGKTEGKPRERITRRLRQKGSYAEPSNAHRDTPRNTWIEIPVPALVDEQTFAWAQERLDDNKRLSSRNTTEPTLLQGLLACEQCSYAYYRTSTRTSKRNIYYYRCLGSDRYRWPEGRKCESRPLRQDYLDGLVWEHVVHLLEDPRLIREEIDRRLESGRRRSPVRRRRDTVSKELQRVHRSCQKLVDAYQEDLLPLDELRPRIRELRKRQSALETEQRSLESQQVDEESLLHITHSVDEFVKRLSTSAETLDIHQRQQVVRLVVKEVLIGQDTIRIKHSIPIGRAGPAGDAPTGPSFPSYLLCTGSHTRALRDAFLRLPPLPLFQHTGVQPLPDMPPHAPVAHPVFDEPHQPLVVDGIVAATDVCVEHPVHLPLLDTHRQRVQRHVRRASRAKPVAEAEEVDLVHGVEHLHGRALDDLVFQHGHAEGPLPSILLRDVGPFHRLGSVRSALQPRRQIRQVRLQILAVAVPRHAVHPRCGIALEAEVGLPKTVGTVDVVPERRKLLFPITFRCLTYPVERLLQVAPDLRPGLGLLARVALGLPPSLHPLRRHRGSHVAVVRGLRRYYGAVRLPAPVHRRYPLFRFPLRTQSPSTRARRGISRLPHEVLGCMPRVSDRAGARRHSRCRGAGCGLRSVSNVSAPGSGSCLSRLNTGPTPPPANASPRRLPDATHDSGLSWFATPSTQMTFTSYTSPV
jgi:site-specific DNA recombinase